MDNPFSNLKKEYVLNKLLEEGFEEVDGPLQCQNRECLEAVPEGLYNGTAKVLTWRCSKGHVSRLENFVA